MTNTEIALPAIETPEGVEFALDQRRARAYAESGYWPDVAKLAQALVKIEAGRALNLPPLVAMTEVHVIDGKPTLGAGANAALVKAHPRYDYRVTKLTDDECFIEFTERGELLGTSTFTRADAERAKLLNKGPWSLYPRNMLFARAMSNGVAWFCPDVTMGRIYTPEELGEIGAPPPTLPDEAPAPAGAALELPEEDIPWPDPDPYEEPPDPTEYEPAPEPK